MANETPITKHLIFVLVLGACQVVGSSVVAQTAEELYETEPFDIIALAGPGGEVHKVLPITSFPNRRVPASPKSSDSFKVRMLANPDQELIVQWGSVRSVELFENRILRQARTFAKERNFDEAFGYLAFLSDRYPKTVGLNTTLETLLEFEAKQLFAQKQFERAWVLLDELYRRNPSRPKLKNALSVVLSRLFSSRIQERDFADARRIFNVTKERYGRNQQELQDKWRGQMERFGGELLKRAKNHLAKNEYREAYVSGRRLMDLWPETPGARELSEQLTSVYPIVTVGVSQAFTGDLTANDFNVRASRRCRRLLGRNLFEMVDVDAEGGRYVCPFGNHKISTDSLNMQLQLTTLQQKDANISGFTIARQLKLKSNPESETYEPQWATYFDQAKVDKVYGLNLTLDRPHLRIESIMDLRLDSGMAEDNSLSSYLFTKTKGSTDVQFVANDNCLVANIDQPREVIEKTMANTQSAISALRSGEIDVVERILPADVALLEKDESLVVSAYRVPSIHMLVPNYDRQFPGSRAFRLALLYGTNREKILRRDLLGGNDVKGCRVISGPFSAGIGMDDPLGYAYDTNIGIRPYEPTLAKLRLQIALIEAANAAKKAEKDAPEVGEITLVFPSDEIARLAAQEIANNWQTLGLTCKLEELLPGKNKPDHNRWDFLYVDAQLSEPLTAARSFLSDEGFARCRSPYLNLAIRQLTLADSWNVASRRLRAIHQTCFDDVSVIPLWQIVDHFAYRAGILGIGEQPITLYQNVEQWRVSSE